MTKTFTIARMPVAEKKDANVRTPAFFVKTRASGLQGRAVAGGIVWQETIWPTERVVAA